MEKARWITATATAVFALSAALWPHVAGAASTGGATRAVAQSSPAPTAPTPSPTTTEVPITIGDTMLDISHAEIDASIVGCDVHPGDPVLVNGTSADGVLWDHLRVVPSGPIALTPAETNLLTPLQPPPETLPVISFRLKPGYYNIGLSVGKCSSKPFPLVAADFYGYRRITLILGPTANNESSHIVIGGTPLNTAGLYGDMPLADLQILLTNAESRLFYVARTEDDSDFLGHHYVFFFDAVKPGLYMLSVAGFGWSKDVGSIDVSKAGVLLWRHITSEDLGL